MDTTERLVIDLPKELVDKLREHVASGAFESESRVVEAVLKASYYGDEGDDLSPEELEEVRAAIAEGIADIEAGRTHEADEVFKELRQIIAEYEKRSA